LAGVLGRERNIVSPAAETEKSENRKLKEESG